MNHTEILKSFAPPSTATASEKWIHEQGYGMTAGECWVMLEETGVQGFAADEFRAQFLASGTLDWDSAARTAREKAMDAQAARTLHPGTCSQL